MVVMVQIRISCIYGIEIQNNDSYLPLVVWVEIDDNIDSGPTYFPDNNDCRNWVPIGVKTSYVTNIQDKVTSSCTMFLLHLCWVFTPWKIQGQTISDTLVANLGKLEKSPGLSDVFFTVTEILKFIDR